MARPGGPDALPPAATGHARLDAEHADLQRQIGGLRELCREIARPDAACPACRPERRAGCEQGMVVALSGLISLIFEHFVGEEAVMHDSLMSSLERELCQAHMEAHATISAEVQRIVGGLTPTTTLDGIRQLEAVLQDWLAEHVPGHDQGLVDWLERRHYLPRAG